MEIKDLILNPFFKNFVITVCTTGVTIFVKYTTRNDNHKSFRKEDLAVGFELIITAIVIMVLETTDSLIEFAKSHDDMVPFDNKLISLPYILLIMGLFLWGLSTMVRKKGWEDEERLHKWWGIILPDLFGLITLIIAVSFTNPA